MSGGSSRRKGGKVVERVELRRKVVSAAVASALGAQPTDIVRRTVIKNGKPIAHGFVRKRS